MQTPSMAHSAHSVIDQVSWLMEHLEEFFEKGFVENKSDLSMIREDLDSCCEEVFRRTVRSFASYLNNHQDEEAFASLKAATTYTFRDPDRLYRSFHTFVAPFMAEKKAISLAESEKELQTLDDRLAIHKTRIQDLKGIISKRGTHKASGEEMANLAEEFIEYKVLGMAEELLSLLSTPKLCKKASP